jgi:hypothetical protein
MKQILLLVFSLCWGYAFAQPNPQTTTGEPKNTNKIENKRTQEDEWTKKLFAENYSKQQHKKYTGKIITKANSFSFENVVIQVSNTNSILKSIIGSGLIYPELLDIVIKTDEKDTLTIQQLEELFFPNIHPTSKRFRFSGSKKNLLNPTVYFLELTNDKATAKTKLADFIKGSSLTFFTEGWTKI